MQLLGTVTFQPMRLPLVSILTTFWQNLNLTFPLKNRYPVSLFSRITTLMHYNDHHVVYFYFPIRSAERCHSLWHTILSKYSVVCGAPFFLNLKE